MLAKIRSHRFARLKLRTAVFLAPFAVAVLIWSGLQVRYLWRKSAFTRAVAEHRIGTALEIAALIEVSHRPASAFLDQHHEASGKVPRNDGGAGSLRILIGIIAITGVSAFGWLAWDMNKAFKTTEKCVEEQLASPQPLNCMRRAMREFFGITDTSVEIVVWAVLVVVVRIVMSVASQLP